MDKIEHLNNLPLHDADVVQLEADFSVKTVRIKAGLSGEATTLVFKDFHDLKFDGGTAMEELEISAVNFSFHDSIFTGEFLFLTGFGLPSVSLNFKFADFEIIIANTTN